MIQNPAPPRAGRREWIGLSVLALACLMYVMDLTVLHLAVPSLSADLHPSSARLKISISALTANAARSDRTPNAAAPMNSSLRRPMRSPSVPIVTRKPATMKP